jgi:hypothetical protein
MLPRRPLRGCPRLTTAMIFGLVTFVMANACSSTPTSASGTPALPAEQEAPTLPGASSDAGLQHEGSANRSDDGSSGDASPCADAVCPKGCFNLNTDVDNCGSCGAKCAVGAPCVGGVCADPCKGQPAGGTICGSTCAYLASDRHHCGACGRACGGTDICSGGTCRAMTQTCKIVNGGGGPGVDGIICDVTCPDGTSCPPLTCQQVCASQPGGFYCWRTYVYNGSQLCAGSPLSCADPMNTSKCANPSNPHAAKILHCEGFTLAPPPAP